MQPCPFPINGDKRPARRNVKIKFFIFLNFNNATYLFRIKQQVVITLLFNILILLVYS